LLDSLLKREIIIITMSTDADPSVYTIRCLLCGGLYIDQSYKKHLFHGHGVTVHMKFLLAVSEFNQENSCLPTLTTSGSGSRIKISHKSTENAITICSASSDKADVPKKILDKNVDEKEVNNIEQDQSRIKTSPSANECSSFVNKCKLCKQKFITKYHLVEHYKQEHIENDKFKDNFTNQLMGKLFNSCPFCESKFSTKYSVDRHIKNSCIQNPTGHLKSESDQFESKSVSTTRVLPKSFNRRPVGQGYLPCPHCNTKFYERVYLVRHVRKFCKEAPTRKGSTATSPEVITDLVNLQSFPQKKMLVNVPEKCGN